MNLLRKVSATLEMIKVVVREFQGALSALSDPGHIETMGFRTL
jgi:hypothetical protein